MSQANPCLPGRKRHHFPKFAEGEAPKCLKCGYQEGPPAPTGTQTGMIVGDAVPLALPPPISSRTEIGELPTHSKLGASGAERWMKCPGSVKLTEWLRARSTGEPDDPEWTKDGTEAHALAAYVLENDIPEVWMARGPMFPRADRNTADGVQVYVDYIRTAPGLKRYEIRLHRPDLHPLMFGTIDCDAYVPAGTEPYRLEVIDYKNGAGVVVGVEDNVQLRYYAAMIAVGKGDTGFLGSDRVKLTIVQPNAGGQVIRSTFITVYELQTWVDEELVPAMNQAQVGGWLDMGKHCQFCPAKLICPAMHNLAAKFAGLSEENIEETNTVRALSNGALGALREQAIPIRFLLKAIETETYNRLMDRQEVPGSKLIFGRSNRVWKEGAEEAAVAAFGIAASKTAVLSPTGIEALPGGKDFVAEWAVKPPAGYTLAYESDPKPAVVPKDATSLLSSAPASKPLDGMI